ncbi:Crp/Fnr family transcriptional regulator [Proteocatella sphenisci]|uniref:Crp/Fnr family transcriptional regulator n=1 Tax=Proteocatella sphenisci TaxID=181070 RepID=UPI0004916751|nr:Crp/Fnr family transcriptional regulator [Proteocatella sphenisci]
MDNTRKCLLRIDILKDINETTLNLLEPSASIRNYKKNEHIFFDREEVENFYFIVSGKAGLYKLNNKHEKKVIFVYGNGSFLNEVMLQDIYASINCEILTDSKILCISKVAFMNAMEMDFKLSKEVMDSMALKIRRLYHQIKNTSSTVRLDKQIAAKLWKLSIDHGKVCEDGIMIDFDLTITYLADLVGSKRETVSRYLKILSDNSLIIIRKNRFIIKDRELLLKYFNES